MVKVSLSATNKAVPVSRASLQAQLDSELTKLANGPMEDLTFDMAEYVLRFAKPSELYGMMDNPITRKMLEIIIRDERFNEDTLDNLSAIRMKELRKVFGPKFPSSNSL